jgi:toxin FitB
MNWLLDTNVISELRKLRPHENVLTWYRSVNVNQMHTSTLNIAELVYGAEIQKDLIKRRELLRWIDEDVRRLLSGRIKEISENVLVRWRIVTRETEIKKEQGPATDLLIAAAALEYQLQVVTRDTNPFIATGVPTFNPWTGERFNGA